MQLNPTVAEIAEAAKAYEGKGRKEVTEALKHRIGEIEAVHEQLTDGYDWSKATKLDGEDKATKRANFRKMNADLAALRERMSEIQGIDRSVDAKDRAAEIAARNGGSRPSAEAQGQAVTAIQRVDTHKLARDQRMTFLRAAAEKAGLDVASAGYGHDSLIYKLAHNRDGGASKVEISLDDMLGPQGPVNVLTSADAGGAGGGFSIYPPMTDRVVEGIFPPRRVIDILPRERTTSNQYRYMASGSIQLRPCAHRDNAVTLPRNRKREAGATRTKRAKRSLRSGNRRAFDVKQDQRLLRDHRGAGRGWHGRRRAGHDRSDQRGQNEP